MDVATAIQLILPVTTAIISFAIGMGLTVADFTRIARQPVDFGLGYLLQVIGLPAAAFIFAATMAVEPVIAAGLMLLAACPGGTLSNLLCYLARADTALSISLTAASTMTAVLTMPWITIAAFAYFLGATAPDISVTKTVLFILALLTVPTLLGMVVKAQAPSFAKRAEPTLRAIATIFFIGIVAIALLANRQRLQEILIEAGGAMAAFHFIVLAAAATLAYLIAGGIRQRVTITLEVGIQNSALAIVLAQTLFERKDLAIAPAVYSLIMLVTAALTTIIAQRILRPAPA